MIPSAKDMFVSVAMLAGGVAVLGGIAAFGIATLATGGLAAFGALPLAAKAGIIGFGVLTACLGLNAIGQNFADKLVR